MKRIYSFLFAILTLAATTGVFTSCQEDAPEIDYTINITVNNDFTEVVDAINNGTLKQEAAIAALTAAINSMNGEQNAKMDAIVKAINDLAKTTDAKLAIIEAAMKAQTLALENKLALLETAIKNIPDYSEKMDAIEAAIKNAPDYTTALEEIKEAIADAEDSFATQLGLLITAIEELPNYGDQLTAIKDAIPTIPNYEDQFGALELALEAIAEKIEAQEGQYADVLAALKTSIDAIKSEVAAGNLSQKEALEQIITLLESGAIAGGGSGSGSGGEGEGGEGSGGEGESTIPTVSFKTSLSIGATINIELFYKYTLSEVEGAELVSSEYDGSYTTYTYRLTNQEVILRGETLNEMLILPRNGITSLDLSKAPDMIHLNCVGNELTYLDVSNNKKLNYLACSDNPITPENMTKLVGYLVDRNGKDQGTFNPKAYKFSEYGKATVSDVKIATDKNWKVCYADHTALYPGE